MRQTAGLARSNRDIAGDVIGWLVPRLPADGTEACGGRLSQNGNSRHCNAVTGEGLFLSGASMTGIAKRVLLARDDISID